MRKDNAIVGADTLDFIRTDKVDFLPTNTIDFICANDAATSAFSDHIRLSDKCSALASALRSPSVSDKNARAWRVGERQHTKLFAAHGLAADLGA